MKQPANPNDLAIAFEAAAAFASEITKAVKSGVNHLQCNAPTATPKAAVVTAPSQNWDALETPALARKLGNKQFESWQHLNGVIETPDTAIHIHAYNMDMAFH